MSTTQDYLEEVKRIAVESKLIIEQFQKLLGVSTSTQALSKIAVLMREESEIEIDLKKHEKFFQSVLLAYVNYARNPIVFLREVESSLNQFREERNDGKCITPYACPNYACPVCDCSAQAGTARRY